MHQSRALAALALALLAGCAQLPAGGPSTGDIVAAKTDDVAARYLLVDIDSSTVTALEGRRNTTFSGHFGTRGGGASEAIGVGDFVTVTIWEAGNGGLFSGTADTGSRTATIPEQPVSQAGTIQIPYAGTVQVAGRTPDQVKGSIEAALAGKAIEPQALVSVSKSVFNTATVTGEVSRGGRVPLTGRGDRILDVIAAAGGVSAPVHEVFVQLARGSRSARVPMQRIVDEPAENIIVQPKDTLTLVRDPQTFTAFGATGKNAEVTFGAVGISLSEALAKAGGLLDNRADPTGVFLFRWEPAELARRLKPDANALIDGRDMVPVIYRLDFRDPAKLFLSQRFRVYDKDLLYVTNAPLNQLQKFVVLINAVVAPVRSGAQVSNYLQ